MFTAAANGTSHFAVCVSGSRLKVFSRALVAFLREPVPDTTPGAGLTGEDAMLNA